MTYKVRFESMFLLCCISLSVQNGTRSTTIRQPVCVIYPVIRFMPGLRQE